MARTWIKVPVVICSIAATCLLYALMAYIASYRSDIYKWLLQVYTVELHIAKSFFYEARAGYTHLYLLRLFLGYVLVFLGGYYAFISWLWPLTIPAGRGIRLRWQSVRGYLMSPSGSISALLLQTVFSTMLTLVCLEVLLRLLGFYATYTESIGQGYISYFDQVTFNRYNTYGIRDSMILDHKDFKYSYKLNELGQREHSLKPFCDTIAFKVITLGDSYTEGVGASYDSSWPQALQRKANISGHPFALYNGGQSGNDPFFEYMLYHERLRPCAPDIVMVAINISDISDYYYRGGMERFHADGSVHFRHGSWMERLYASSKVFRFISIDLLQQRPQMFIRDAEYSQYEKAFVRDARDVLMRLQQSVHPGKLLVIIHPGPMDCAGPDDDYVRHGHSVLAAVIEDLDKSGIYIVDLYQALGQTINDRNVMQYTYEHDKHYNGKGYQLYADKLWQEIERKYPGFWQRHE